MRFRLICQKKYLTLLNISGSFIKTKILIVEILLVILN